MDNRLVDNNKYKILIVDDDKFLLDVYSVKFKEAGHELVTVLSADEALDRIKKSDDFDAIVLDLLMPTMDGFEFLTSLKENNLAKNTALIILTNQGEAKDVDKAKNLDIDGYIVKASSIPAEVLAEVLEIIEKRSKRI